MSWNDIKATNSVTVSFSFWRDIFIDLLGYRNGSQSKNYVTTITIKKSLRKLYDRGIYPEAVYTIVLSNTGLLEYLRKNKVRDFIDGVMEEVTKPNTEELLFAALIYTKYSEIGNLNILLNSEDFKKYPFLKITDDFISNMKNKYPFLFNTNHLDYVKNLLSQKDILPYELVKNGIKEKYDA